MVEQQESIKICSICDSNLEYFKKENYYKCPLCFTEVWPNEERLKQLEREKKRMETAEQDRQRSLGRIGWDKRTEVLPIYPYPSGSGGSKSGRKRKKPKKPRKEYLVF